MSLPLGYSKQTFAGNSASRARLADSASSQDEQFDYSDEEIVLYHKKFSAYPPGASPRRCARVIAEAVDAEETAKLESIHSTDCGRRQTKTANQPKPSTRKVHSMSSAMLNGRTHQLAKSATNIHEGQVPEGQDLVAATEKLQELPPWLKALREAMQDSVKGDDIKEVMKAQIEKAKSGDMKAASFVMNQAHKLMSTAAPRPVTLVQNNHHYHGAADETANQG